MYAAIFGSAARGSQDSLSDYDLIVVFDKNEIQNKEAICENFSAKTGSTSISTYSEERINRMWAEGSPFAWHLHLEHKQIPGYKYDIFQIRPQEYHTYLADIESMTRVLQSSLESLMKSDSNMIFEAGIHYVCSRNIAMFASKPLLGFFDFSRKSPFTLNSVIQFPLSEEVYSILTLARFTSTRGIGSQIKITWVELYQWSGAILNWARSISDLIHKRGENNEQAF